MFVGWPAGLLVLAVPVAAMWPEPWLVGDACHYAAGVNYDKCNYEDSGCLCSDDNYLATVAYCISQHTTDRSLVRDEAWNHFSLSVCSIYNAAISDRSFDSAMRYLNVSMGANPPADKPSADGGPITHPVKISDDTYNVSYRAVHNYLRQKDIGVWQGSFLVAYWLLLALAAGASRLWRYMGARFSSARVSLARPGPWGLWWQKHVALPACFGLTHSVRFRVLWIPVTIPTRSEVLILGVYLLLNVIFTVAPYTFLDQDPLYPTHYRAMLRYVSDRSGIIGVIQMPLFTMFAGRNNMLIWITGWPYAKFNRYHRAIARVAYMQFIVHSVTKHVLSASYGGSMTQYFYDVPYYRYGVSAMGLMAIMIASGWIRHRYYEFFLRLHIFAATGAFLCVLYHLNGLGYKETVYVSLGVWCLDWLLRLGRLVFVNVSILMRPVLGSSRLTYGVARVLNNEITNISIHTPIRWKFRPGQYVYVYVTGLSIWEAHPFSLVGPDRTEGSFQVFCRSKAGFTKRMCRRLADKHGCTADNEITLSVLVEGPYGVHCPVERYDSILLVAGGIGITGVLPYAEFLARQEHNPEVVLIWVVRNRDDVSWLVTRLDRLCRDHNKVSVELYATATRMSRGGSFMMRYDHKLTLPPGYSGGQNPYQLDLNLSEVTLTQSAERRRSSGGFKGRKSIVTIESSDDDSFRDIELDNLPPKSELIQVYPPPGLVQPKLQSKVYSDRQRAQGEVDPFSKTVADDIRLYKPNLGVTVEDFFKKSRGSVAVLGCGPPSMMDTLRQHTAESVEEARYGRVDYFEEAFGW